MKWLVSQGGAKAVVVRPCTPPPPSTPSNKGSSTEMGYSRFSANTIVAAKVSCGIRVGVCCFNGGWGTVLT
ncbi:unnamed protein product [Ectocarpus sp. 12 AP-2014]